MNVNVADLSGIVVFVAVVDVGGFTAAARELDHSISFVSKEIARLERRLGVRLLNRTTRSVVPTDSGRAYYERCKLIVASAQEAERAITEAHDNPQGPLHISVPLSFSLTHLNDRLADFVAAYPDIMLSVEASERVVDLIAEGFDVVIRVGHLRDSNLIARQLMSSRRMTVASPDYLKRNRTPQTPRDLVDHMCINYADKRVTTHWEFLDPNSGTIGVNVNPRVVCNSAEAELALALAGSGITRLPSYVCEAAVKRHKLIPILEQFELPPVGIYAIYPHRAHLSARVRVFVDFLVDQFARD